MEMSKAMKLVLKAASYSDITKTYRLQRAAQNVGAKLELDLDPNLVPFQDYDIEAKDRTVLTRLYTPSKTMGKSLIIFFHGGGWVTETVDTYNRVCSNLAKTTGHRVLSVDYALAPERKFPYGVEECYAVTEALMNSSMMFGINADEIVLMGDSAGGNLTAAVSQMGRDRNTFTVKRQVLVYPVTYHDHTETSPYESIRTNATGYLLTSKHLCEYMSLYSSDPSDAENPYYAPLCAKDLSNQPDTLLITAEFDPLRDEGEAYGEALRQAGNHVEMHRVPNALHGYLQLDLHYPMVQKTFDYIDEFLNGARKHDR